MRTSFPKKLLFVFLVLVVGTFLGYQASTFFYNLSSTDKGEVSVFIKPRSTAQMIRNQLHQEGVLLYPQKFYLLVRLTRNERSLKPGEYRFQRPTPPWSVLRKLVEGQIIRHKITFPEGLTMEDMAQALAQKDLVDLHVFQSLLTRKDLFEKHHIPGNSFEGFLFPDTYLFSKTEGEEKILAAMVKRFKDAISSLDERAAQDLGLNLLQWVTLASIIEKESGMPAEHVLISSVFHNRLKKGMRLQSDPTVIYAIPDFDGNLTREHLETPTPYNTYTQAGLPPGPIANPGLSALTAAIYPLKTDYLYFVANKKGGHVFSKTYEEHIENIAIYQLNRRRDRKKRF